MTTDTDTDTERVQRFVEELGELSRRTGVSIFGCGCCGSPRLELDEDPKSDYVVDYDSGARREHQHRYTFAQLRWRPRDEDPHTPKDYGPGLDDAPLVLLVAR